jgi:biopolymer transport protein ExbD
MNKLKFIFLVSILSLSIACSPIKTVVGKLAGTNKAPEQTVPPAALTMDVKNSTADPHVEDEKAIVITARYGGQYYFGEDQYPSEIMGEKLNSLLEKNPSERQLIYLNADSTNKYGDLVRVLDRVRTSKVENIGLIVASNGKAESGYHVLKVKILPEPKVDDLNWDSNAQILDLQKEGKINFVKVDKKDSSKQDKKEIKPEEIGSYLSKVMSESGDKTIRIKAAHSTRYDGLVHLVDAAVGAGATVYLQLDDLPL